MNELLEKIKKDGDVVATTLEGLKDEMRVCNCCGEKLLASTNKNISEFTYYCKNNKYYYFQENCRTCQNEITSVKDKQVKERIRQKIKLERANREWSIYKMTIDLSSIEDRLEERFKRWHERYYYIGVTKREPQKRWNEHLYDLKVGKHNNKVMQSIYNKIRKVYPKLNNEEYENILVNDIIKFEVIITLDKDMEEYEAHKHEAFEIKALEHELFYNIKESYKRSRLNRFSEKDISYLKDDMIVNNEHCISTKRALNEHKKTTLCDQTLSCS